MSSEWTTWTLISLISRAVRVLGIRPGARAKSGVCFAPPDMRVGYVHVLVLPVGSKIVC